LKATSLNINRRSGQFRPLMNSASVQPAVMTLRHGESSSDDIENEHPRAEQWLFVVSGTGIAKVARRRIRLHSGVLLFIPKRAPHQITNTGRAYLVTLNFYAPPAYTPTGDVRPSVKRLR
jgi:mannose-6-phosphate isomerase-like protein (cupin superfamily)